jgi:molybdopterin molybdotransferase
MVSIQEATALVLASCYKPAPITVTITQAVGKVLAENIIADRDFPPFNRVAMDGIAIRHSQWKKGGKKFYVEQIQAAGESQKNLQQVEHCIEVMTGSMVPEGTDAIIRYEDVEIKNGYATISVEDVKVHQNIHKRGQDARQNDVLLESGIILSPAEIALLASVGKNTVKVFSHPKAAIVASGDELVEVSAIPQPYQIRCSNGYAIEAAMMKMGWPATQFHLPDEKDNLKKSLQTIVSEHDVIILSGGVSKGKFDYVPEVLTDIGINKLFHQVSQRPGKPFWFGVSASGKVAFALPGNPVSTFMCFQRYIKPWFLKSLGISVVETKAILGTDFSFEPKVTYFLQVKIKNEEGRLVAYPNPGGGSGDFANLKDVDGFLELPLEKTAFKAGDTFPYIPFRD